jgi:SAM-dependent methyltransferase
VTQDEINRQVYNRADVVRLYATVQIDPPEAVALVRYREDVQGRRVLDMGCGAGRLAAYLAPLTDHYVGLDLSEHMVAYCRQHFDKQTFVQGDMCRLPFEAGAFEAVFAVCNLIDAVSAEDRLVVLAEVRRVLVPGGLLLFSSHNRHWVGAGAPPRLERRRNPLTQLHCLWEYWQGVANHRRLRPSQRLETDHALLTDVGHNYACLHYYITRDAQARQLAAAGFRLLECLDERGRTLHAGDDDSAWSSIHYVARSL